MLNPIVNNQDKKSKTIRTTCPYCGVGCGVLATIDEVGYVTVQGDPNHPANFGKLCSKGSALAQTLGTSRRITQPYYQNKRASIAAQQPLSSKSSSSNAANINANQPLIAPQLIKNTNWDTVLDDIAGRFNDTIAKHGRDSIMFYVSGQFLTEDYYVANKFIKGFIGNNNIDSNSRLCMSSPVAGHTRAFGEDLVPGNYEDFEHCDLLVMVGSNMAWCYPILFGRFLAAKKANPNKKLIVIDPRRTDSCEFADMHLPIASGTDTHLFNGLLCYLEQHGCRDEAYVHQSRGVDDALAAASEWDIQKVAAVCEVSAASIRTFYEAVAMTDKTVTAFSMGVNQSKSGTDNVNAIINTHLLTGRVGRVGASPFSLTGQPNAMGGREVGGLANLLAAHLRLDNANHRQLVEDFWHTPQPIAPMAGIKACDVADAIFDGRIKALWIMATNPVVSLPEAEKFRQALAECDLVIVSDCSKDSDTVQCADIVLPAQGWGEKSGTVTNSERRISRQRALLPALGESKPDWWILSQVAKRMGMTGFDYQHAYEVFSEHVALTAYQNAPSDNASSQAQQRHLNLAKEFTKNAQQPALSLETYNAMQPFQWGGARIPMVNVTDDRPLIANLCTKAEMIAVNPLVNASLPNTHHAHLADNIQSIEQAIGLRLITGRLRDQWHTMTRTGTAPQLNQHQPAPMLTMHPDDAKRLNVDTNDFVQLHPRHKKHVGEMTAHAVTDVHLDDSNSVIAQVSISDSMRVGDAFMPIHWSNAFASFARVGTLIPTLVDPHSSQPELKNSAISVTPIPMQAFGSILVHPRYKDTIVVQLRAMLAEFNKSKNIDADPLLESDLSNLPNLSALPSKLPALTWNLSHQINSILINIASPIASIAARLSTPEFWQGFIDAITGLADADIHQTHQVTPHILSLGATNTAYTIDNAQRQLRFIMTESSSHQEPSNIAIDTDITAAECLIEGMAENIEERLIMAVYIAPTQAKLPSAHWLDSCFADTRQIPDNQRYKWLLAGRPASGYSDPGPLVCSCMSVGENTIIAAIESGCTTAAAVGKQCQAGTNCGSCVGQINLLIAKYSSLEPA